MQRKDDPLIGQLVSGRYRVKRVLGTGGMGQVYLAEHEAIQKPVALKVLHLHYSKRAEIVTRFRQEAISASRIKHPNVLEVFDFGQLEDGSFFLAMEFLQGCDLADDLKHRTKLDPDRAITIALSICRALGAAHQQGVVHRDMKPENVFLQKTPDGEEIVKIVDFGIAQLRSNDDLAEQAPKRRLTKTGMIFGTPEYMAPEQAAGRAVDLRADVYAVGVILYELFSGAVPFTGSSFLEVLNKHLNDSPPKMAELSPGLEVSEELEATLARALAKKPDDRYASMQEFAQALLATPEGRAFGVSRLSAVTDLASAPLITAPAALPPGAPTAAQFRETAESDISASHADARTAASNTQLEGTRSAERRSGGAPSLVLALGGLLAVGVVGVGAFLMLKQSSLTSTTPGAESVAPPASQASAPSSAPPDPAPPDPAPQAPTPSADIAPLTRVSLSVVTEPAGALLFKDGFQVCDSTPCAVSAAINESLELEARKGAAKGTARVLAQRDQTVTMKLETPKVRPRRSQKGTGKTGEPAEPKTPRMCEVEVDGLKILRACE